MRHRILGLAIVAAAALTVPAAAGTWVVPDDFMTIQAAVDSAMVQSGDTLRLSAGNHAGALVTKQLTIKGEDGATINDGPVHGSGLIQGFRLLEGSDGTTLSHLRYTVDLAIMNGAGVDDVTVSHSTFENTIQGVSNWRGNGWEISHNKFFDLRTRCGGGIGVLIADFSGGDVLDNMVTHNHVMGTLHVDPDDCGGYSGSGIVLYGDFRWGMAGVGNMSGNRVLKNKINMVSDTPDLVDIIAFELTESRNDADPVYQGCDIIHDNAIGFNNFSGCVEQQLMIPEALDTCNKFSRNLGENRGHGMHPKQLFKPEE